MIEIIHLPCGVFAVPETVMGYTHVMTQRILGFFSIHKTVTILASYRGFLSINEVLSNNPMDVVDTEGVAKCNASNNDQMNEWNE